MDDFGSKVDPELRGTGNVPVKVGYEIPFNRHFYEYTSPRPLEEIGKDIKGLEHDIVKMLTHFLRMDGGGKKYYLLEREHISEMILAVPEGLYSDFILINRHGVVVYSRENDEIFGKNVRTGLSESPLARCFAQQDRALHVEDVAVFPSGSGRYGIFISSRIEVENTFHGIFILQAGVEKVEGYLDAGTELLYYDGR